MRYGKNIQKNSRGYLSSKNLCSSTDNYWWPAAVQKTTIRGTALALKKQTGVVPKRWLKSNELRRLLKVSPGTLQTLKLSGIIPYTKIGGVHFYDYEDIQKLVRGWKNEYKPSIDL